MRKLFRALQYPHYRLFFLGQTISLMGTWMQHVSVAWLVYRLTQSPFWLGVAAFSVQMPTFLLGPVAGVMADRWNRHRTLLVTQSLAALQALVLGILTLSSVVTVGHVLVLAMLLGFIHAFDIPARQSFFVELIGKKEDLGNAIALNSSIFNLARMVGPAVAGLIVVAASQNGEAICFLLNALSFVPVILVLLKIRVPAKEKNSVSAPVWHELKKGVVYAWGLLPIRWILLLLFAVGLLGMPYTVLLPIYASELLQGNARIYGFLVACSALGALVGALSLAWRKNPAGLERKIALAAGVFGIGLVTFSQYHYLVLSLIIMFGTGFALMVMMSSCNTVLQCIVEDTLRGRVMSFYTMSFMGAAPLGNLLFGTLASHVGTTPTLLLGGSACMVAAFLFSMQLKPIVAAVRPIYEQQGLLKKEMTVGIQAATEITIPRPKLEL